MASAMCFIPRHLIRLLPLRQSAPLAGVSFVDFLPAGNLPVFLLEILPFFQKTAARCLEKMG
jgi:hypothetical protein